MFPCCSGAARIMHPRTHVACLMCFFFFGHFSNYLRYLSACRVLSVYLRDSWDRIQNQTPHCHPPRTHLLTDFVSPKYTTTHESGRNRNLHSNINHNNNKITTMRPQYILLILIITHNTLIDRPTGTKPHHSIY